MRADGSDVCAGPAGPRLREARVHDTSLDQRGGLYGEIDAARDIDGGAMDGFVASAIDGNHTYCAANPFSLDRTADTRPAALRHALA